MVVVTATPAVSALWFLAWTTGVLVCTSSAILFWIAYYREWKLRYAWRAVGFLGLALSFAARALSWWFPQAALASFILDPFAFFAIYRGVYYEPILTHLRSVATKKERRWPKKTASLRLRRTRLHLASVVAIGGLLWLGAIMSDRLFSVAAYSLSGLFIGLTIQLQGRRLLWERDSFSVQIQNFYPLLGYLLLFFSVVLLLPLPIFVSHGPLSATFLVLSMICLWLWAWLFIRVRNILRRSVLLLTFLTIGSSVTVFILTYSITRLIRWLVITTA